MSFEDLIATGATTAETIEQLAIEVETLRRLEQTALGVVRSGEDANGRSSTGFSTTSSWSIAKAIAASSSFH